MGSDSSDSRVEDSSSYQLAEAGSCDDETPKEEAVESSTIQDTVAEFPEDVANIESVGSAQCIEEQVLGREILNFGIEVPSEVTDCNDTDTTEQITSMIETGKTVRIADDVIPLEEPFPPKVRKPILKALTKHEFDVHRPSVTAEDDLELGQAGKVLSGTSGVHDMAESSRLKDLDNKSSLLRKLFRNKSDLPELAANSSKQSIPCSVRTLDFFEAPKKALEGLEKNIIQQTDEKELNIHLLSEGICSSPGVSPLNDEYSKSNGTSQWLPALERKEEIWLHRSPSILIDMKKPGDVTHTGGVDEKFIAESIKAKTTFFEQLKTMRQVERSKDSLEEPQDVPRPLTEHGGIFKSLNEVLKFQKPEVATPMKTLGADRFASEESSNLFVDSLMRKAAFGMNATKIHSRRDSRDLGPETPVGGRLIGKRYLPRDYQPYNFIDGQTINNHRLKKRNEQDDGTAKSISKPLYGKNTKKNKGKHILDSHSYLYQWLQLKTYGTCYSPRGGHGIAIVPTKVLHAHLNLRKKISTSLTRVAWNYIINRRHRFLDFESKTRYTEENDAAVREIIAELKANNSCFSETTEGSTVFVFGGHDGESLFNDLHIFESQKQRWRRIEPRTGSYVPVARTGCQLVYYEGCLYLFGGLSYVEKVYTCLNDLYEFDLARFTWRRVDPPQPDFDLLGDNLIVAAGRTPNEELLYLHRKRCERMLNIIHGVEPNDEVPGHPVPEARRHATVTFAFGHLWLFGGEKRTGNFRIFWNDLYKMKLRGKCGITPSQQKLFEDEYEDIPCDKQEDISSVYFKWIKVYPEVAKKWSLINRRETLARPPLPRSQHVALLTPSYIYEQAGPGFTSSDCQVTKKRVRKSLLIFGGLTNRSKCLNDLFFYEFASNSYLTASYQGGQPPCPRYSCSGVILGDSFFVYGGMTENNLSLSDMHEYNLGTRTWRQMRLGGYPPDVTNLCAFGSVERSMYVFGGLKTSSQKGCCGTYKILLLSDGAHGVASNRTIGVKEPVKKYGLYEEAKEREKSSSPDKPDEDIQRYAYCEKVLKAVSRQMGEEEFLDNNSVNIFGEDRLLLLSNQQSSEESSEDSEANSAESLPPLDPMVGRLIAQEEVKLKLSKQELNKLKSIDKIYNEEHQIIFSEGEEHDEYNQHNHTHTSAEQDDEFINVLSEDDDIYDEGEPIDAT